jgi:molecular chaperone GrpE
MEESKVEAETVETAETVGTPDSVEELKKLLAEEQKKTLEMTENWQRSRADFLNLKRRTEIERANLTSEAKEKILLRVLPVVDDFERAISSKPEALKDEPWVSGVMMIEKKLKTLLEQEGVTEVDSLDANFDPRFHDAVQQDDETSGNTEYVMSVFQKGYKLGDKVIRPAAVKVGHR